MNVYNNNEYIFIENKKMLYNQNYTEDDKLFIQNLLYCDIKKANRKVEVKKLYRLYKDIKNNGQQVEIPVVCFEGELYPAGGATRLASLIALGRAVKIKMDTLDTKRKWNKSKSMETHRFSGLSTDTMKRFKAFLKRRNYGDYKYTP